MKYKKIIISLVGATILVSAISACNRSPWSHHGSANPEKTVTWIKEEIDDRLDLTESQNIELDALADQLIVLYKERKAVKDNQKTIARELFTSPTMDQTKALALVTDHTQYVSQKAPEVISAVAQFTDSLSAEQKQQIGDRFDKWIKRHSDR